jgi:kynurenine formamidase
MYIELSYPINQEMPVAPGLPKLEIIPVNRMSQDAHSNTTVIKIFSHAGTHVDAPFQFYDKGYQPIFYSIEGKNEIQKVYINLLIQENIESSLITKATSTSEIIWWLFWSTPKVMTV